VLSRRNALIVVLVVIATGLGVWIASAALTQVTVVFTIDETDPARLTDPVGDDCPVGAPCKVKSDLNVADVDQPVSSVTSISPPAFTGVVGTLIHNGDVVGKTDVIVHWTFLGSCSSSSPTIEGTNDFLDGGLKGEVGVADDGSDEALQKTDKWPTLLEKDLRVEYLLTTTGHTLLRRSVAVLDFDLPFPYPNIQVPVNLLSFDVSDGDGFGGLTLQGTYNVAVVGDPTSPPGGTMCTPMTSDSLLLGKTAAGLTLLTCEASGTHTMTTVLTREVGGVLVLDTDPPVSDTVNCSLAVGGIAEYPDIAETAGNSASLPSGALAGAAAAGVVVLVGGAWYARRRWVR
jgi:hypothetical protein